MRLITYDDVFDLYYRLNLKGLGFLQSKLNFSQLARTYSSFNSDDMLTSNWWNIPMIRNRWNEKITGSPEVTYVEYVFEKYLKNRQNIKILSPGCGVCTNELRFAEYPSVSQITCIDLAEKPLETARKIAREKNFLQFEFIQGNVNGINFPKEEYDVVLFNSSLHHFKAVEKLLSGPISYTLKPQGLLLINEYVGPCRLQWSSLQLALINELLKNHIPHKYKKRYKSSFYKNNVTGPGILRMLFSDPSEAVDSSSILHSLKKHFSTVEEKQTGGNILMILLKDISWNFIPENTESLNLLKELMEIEDEFLKTVQSDNIFGIYKKKKSDDN